MILLAVVAVPLALVWLFVMLWLWALCVEPKLSRPREAFARPTARPRALAPPRHAVPPVVIDVESRIGQC